MAHANTHLTDSLFIGVLYLLYGLVKLTMGMFLIFAPPKVIADIPFLRFLLKESEDSTLAGRVYEYLLCIFGAYTFLLGLAILNVLPIGMKRAIQNKTTEYTVLFSIGIILAVFYILVLYTSVPISKKLQNYPSYEFFLITAIYFILTPFIMEFITYMLPIYYNLSIAEQTMYGFTLIVVLFIAGDIIYKFIKKRKIPIIAPEYVKASQAVKEKGILITQKTVATFNNN